MSKQTQRNNDMQTWLLPHKCKDLKRLTGLISKHWNLYSIGQKHVHYLERTFALDLWSLLVAQH